jgi:hypothetical protein
LACYFSSSDLVMIYIRNLDWNLSNYSTDTSLINVAGLGTSSIILHDLDRLVVGGVGGAGGGDIELLFL